MTTGRINQVTNFASGDRESNDSLHALGKLNHFTEKLKRSFPRRNSGWYNENTTINLLLNIFYIILNRRTVPEPNRKQYYPIFQTKLAIDRENN